MSNKLNNQNTMTMENTHIMNAYEVCKSAMAHGFVKFSYTKANGETRIAIGTRNPQLLASCNATPKGIKQEIQEVNPNICPYYDLAKGDWRCFRAERFVSLIFDVMTVERACTEAMTTALQAQECVESCINAITGLIGTDMAGRIMNFATQVDCRRFDAEDYEREMFDAVFPEEADYDDEDDVVVEQHDTPSQEQTEQLSDERSTLLAELKALRERETNILMKLLGM